MHLRYLISHSSRDCVFLLCLCLSALLQLCQTLFTYYYHDFSDSTLYLTGFLWFIFSFSFFSVVTISWYNLMKVFSFRQIFIYLFFYPFLLLLLILPIADVLFQQIAGIALTPSAFLQYTGTDSGGKDSSGEGGSLLMTIADGIKMGFDLSPSVCWFSVFFFVIALVLFCFCHLYSWKKKSKMGKLPPYVILNYIWFFSFIFLVVLSQGLLSPRAKSSVKLTMPAEIPFFFSIPQSYTTFHEDQSNIQEPSKSIKFDSLLNDTLTQPTSSDYQFIRDFFPLPSNRFWVSSEYPLVHSSVEKYCELFPEDLRCDELKPDQKSIDQHNDYPDVFFILVESLAGNMLSTADKPVVKDLTPNLLKFWKNHAVCYHESVSNGSPTSSLLVENSIAYTKDIKFNSFPYLIKKSPANYARIYYSATRPNFDGKHRWLDQEDVVDEWFFKYENSKLYSGNGYTSTFNNDRILVKQLKERITKHDQEEPNRPLFMFSLSVSTHHPWTTFDSIQNGGNRNANAKHLFTESYKGCLKYADKHLFGDYINFLKNRKRANNTVVVIVGDHSNYGQNVVPVPKCIDCLPSPIDVNDQMFYTSAFIGFLGGDEQRKNLKIPKAGTKDYRPISNLDMVSTIVDLTGAGKEVTHGFGRSLIDSRVHDDSRKTLSFISKAGELGLKDKIIRTDWMGSKGSNWIERDLLM
ncbi:hypothetical protein GEMRC1_010848 [Eukaryota sp. GEM-RC1]